MARRRYSRKAKLFSLTSVGLVLAGVFAAPFIKPYLDKFLKK